MKNQFKIENSQEKQNNLLSDAAVMTMKAESGKKVKFFIAGTGTISIDWGDGSDVETGELCEYDEDYNDIDKRGKFLYSHTSNLASGTVSITGDNITNLICSGNRLISLDVSNNTALIGLSCSNNHLDFLDISNNTALKWLICSDNRLTTLNVNKNTKLIGLTCYKNQLTSLDLSQNSDLKQLDCSKNPLTSLDICNNTGLVQLCCCDNQLTTLDVTANTKLMELLCYDNLLTTLSVTQNTMLMDLQCDDNQLTSLDLSQNSQLMRLECQNNQLSTLDLSACTMLNHLKCHSNPFKKLEDFFSAILNTRRIQIQEEASNKCVISFPMYKIDGGMYSIYLIAECGKFYLSDEGTTWEELDKIFEMNEIEVKKNLKAILLRYGARKHPSCNAFIIDCTPDDVHLKLSYLIQALSFMLNMNLFYV